MSGFRTILLDRKGPVISITLNRPEVLNAYNTEMRDDLHAALSTIRVDPTVRAVVLQGNGRAFCSGGDIREFGSAPSPVVAREVRWQRDVWGLLRSLRQPTKPPSSSSAGTAAPTCRCRWAARFTVAG